jgi:hypothetical protein
MGNFVIFRKKSSKIDHFTVDPAGLPFAVVEVWLFPVWLIFGLSRQKS